MNKPLSLFSNLLAYTVIIVAITVVTPSPVLASGDAKAPERTTGKGPFKRLILRGGIVINGEGAPARGPMDIVI